MSRWILLRGVDESPTQRVMLQAGLLSLQFEAGTLRYIRLGEREVIRQIYMALRDPSWDTIVPVLSDLQINARTDNFEVTFTASHKRGEIDFSWRGHITGDPQGTVRFLMDGVAHRTFQRARIGFCVLHPMECAGLPVELFKVDGTRERSRFPLAISPHQPFLDLRGMAHEVVPGVLAEVRFEGEIFETEDHRNWTDASFKTYCTPLRLPYPVEVKAGEKVIQSVTLSLHSSQEWKEGRGREWEDHLRSHISVSAASPQAKPLTLSIGEAPLGALPRIGLGMASHGQPLRPQEVSRLKALHLSHLRVDLPLTGSEYERRLHQAKVEAEALGVQLEVALFLPDGAEVEVHGHAPLLDRLKKVLAQIKPPVGTWLIFSTAEKSTTPERLVQCVRPVLTEYAPAAKIGAGTNAYFTEVNREHPPLGVIDLVAYSINPQVHAFDDATLVENLVAQRATVESARRFIGDKWLAITPVTLRPRLKPDGSGPEPKAAPGELPPQVDVRQMSLFGAGWTVGSLKYLAEGGVHSVTYYETTGWRGVMETEQGAPLPDKFPSRPGTVFPLYHVFADVSPFADGTVIPVRSSDSLQADALGVRKDGRTRVIVASFNPSSQQVTVTGLPAQAWLRYLDERHAELAMQEPEAFCREKGKEVEIKKGHLELELPPYGLIRLDY